MRLAVSAVWRGLPWLALRVPARKAAALATILGALGYILLAGVAVTARRRAFLRPGGRQRRARSRCSTVSRCKASLRPCRKSMR
jgi:hypothetical protein